MDKRLKLTQGQQDGVMMLEAALAKLRYENVGIILQDKDLYFFNKKNVDDWGFEGECEPGDGYEKFNFNETSSDDKSRIELGEIIAALEDECIEVQLV